MADLKVNVKTTYDGKGIKDAAQQMEALKNKSIKQLKAELKQAQTALERVAPDGKAFNRYAQQIQLVNRRLDELRMKSKGIGTPLAGNMGSATTSILEFNRVIQDAPYGIQGVGNNIQQLTSNMGQLVTQAGGVRAAMSSLWKSMLTPANLVVLGISAITTAWTIYERQQQKAKKATEEAKDAQEEYRKGLDDYTRSLDAVGRAQINSAANIEQESLKLRVLYGDTQDTTKSLKERKAAVDAIQKEYPSYFGNLKDEQILAGNATRQYDALTTSLIATAKARAQFDILGENAKTLEQIESRQLKRDKERNRASREFLELQERIKKATGITVRVGESQSFLAAEQIALEKEQYEVAKLLPRVEQLSSQLTKIRSEGIQDSSEQIRLTQEQVRLEDSIVRLRVTGAKIFGEDKVTGDGVVKNKQKEVDLEEKLTKLRQESILASMTGYEKEIQESKFKYDALRNQAKEYYEDAKISAQEYIDFLKRVKNYEVAEIGRILQGTGSLIGAGTLPQGGARTGPTSTGVTQVNIQQRPKIDLNSDPVWDDLVGSLNRQLDRAVSSFGRNFLNTITSINKRADAMFGEIVSDIIGSVTGSLTETLTNVLLESFGGLGKALTNLGKSGAAWAGGAGILGSIISGVTPKTSVAGQGVGGALSGAGAGALVGAQFGAAGGPWGAAIGAVVGLVAGLLSGSAAKKRAKVQEEQLKEQKRQTELMERQMRLAYSSAIVGRMTKEGVIGSVEINEFGELTTTLKGSDIVVSYERTKKQQERGG